MASVYRLMEKRKEALETYGLAFKALQSVDGKTPSPRRRLDVAGLLHDRARVHEEARNYKEAEKDVAAARDTLETALAVLPRPLQDRRLQRRVLQDLAQTHWTLGNLHAKQKKLPEALAEYAKAQEGATELREETLGVAHYDQIVGSTCVNIGLIHNLLAQPEKAREPLESGLRLLRRMVEQSPRDAAVLQLLVKGLLGSGQLHISKVQTGQLSEEEEKKELAAALEFYGQARELWVKLARENKDAADLTTFLAIHNGQGLGLSKQKKFKDAVDTYDKAIEAFRKSPRAEQESGEVPEKLMGLLAGRAMALFQLKQFDRALEDVEEARRRGGDPVLFDLFRAGILATSGKHLDGVQAIDKLLTHLHNRETPKLLYAAACVYSLALEGLTRDNKLTESDRTRYGQEYARRAVDLLRRAVKADGKLLRQSRSPVRKEI
jgi:tetratricopeptide (TPR) repeat protein